MNGTTHVTGASAWRWQLLQQTTRSSAGAFDAQVDQLFANVETIRRVDGLGLPISSRSPPTSPVCRRLTKSRSNWDQRFGVEQVERA